MKAPRWTLACWILLVLIAFSTSLLWQSFYLSSTAVQVPQFIIIGTLLLLSVRLILELGVYKGHDAEVDESNLAMPESDESPACQEPLRNRFLLSLFWISLLTFSTWLLGLVVGPALFCLVFLKVFADESWSFCLSYSAVMALLVGLIFSLTLKLTPYQGALAEWLV